jgi:hypothetical protein
VRVRDQNLREELPYRGLHLQRRDRGRRWQRLGRGRRCPDHAASPSGCQLLPPETLRIASEAHQHTKLLRNTKRLTEDA